jgi:hypothetical protein
VTQPMSGVTAAYFVALDLSTGNRECEVQTVNR